MGPLYSDYINDEAIRNALRLPERDEPCPDEALFIRTHQAFELWFAQAIHEIDAVFEQLPEIPRTELSQRTADGAPFDADRWPQLAAAVDGPMRGLGEPGRHRTRSTVHVPAADLERFAATLSRVCTIVLTTNSFFPILRTMTPEQFLRFRHGLAPASGFGSVQFRELELLLGLREANETRLRPVAGRPAEGVLLEPTDETPPAEALMSFARTAPRASWPRLVRRFEQTSLRDVVYAILGAMDLDHETVDRFAACAAKDVARNLQGWLSGSGPLDAVVREVDDALSHHETIAAAMRIGREPATPEDRALLRFLEACLSLDRAFLEWRDLHVRFVESMIGARPGSGGGSANYLRGATERGSYYAKAIPCLWDARTFAQRE